MADTLCSGGVQTNAGYVDDAFRGPKAQPVLRQT